MEGRSHFNTSRPRANSAPQNHKRIANPTQQLTEVRQPLDLIRPTRDIERIPHWKAFLFFGRCHTLGFITLETLRERLLRLDDFSRLQQIAAVVDSRHHWMACLILITGRWIEENFSGHDHRAVCGNLVRANSHSSIELPTQIECLVDEAMERFASFASNRTTPSNKLEDDILTSILPRTRARRYSYDESVHASSRPDVTRALGALQDSLQPLILRQPFEPLPPLTPLRSPMTGRLFNPLQTAEEVEEAFTTPGSFEFAWLENLLDDYSRREIEHFTNGDMWKNWRDIRPDLFDDHPLPLEWTTEPRSPWNTGSSRDARLRARSANVRATTQQDPPPPIVRARPITYDIAGLNELLQGNSTVPQGRSSSIDRLLGHAEGPLPNPATSNPSQAPNVSHGNYFSRSAGQDTATKSDRPTYAEVARHGNEKTVGNVDISNTTKNQRRDDDCPAKDPADGAAVGKIRSHGDDDDWEDLEGPPDDKYIMRKRRGARRVVRKFNHSRSPHKSRTSCQPHSTMARSVVANNKPLHHLCLYSPGRGCTNSQVDFLATANCAYSGSEYHPNRFDRFNSSKPVWPIGPPPIVQRVSGASVEEFHNTAYSGSTDGVYGGSNDGRNHNPPRVNNDQHVLDGQHDIIYDASDEWDERPRA